MLTLHDNRSEISSTLKEIHEGQDGKTCVNLANNITVEVSAPYKNINFRTWISPAPDVRRPGFGIVLSLREFETFWEWAETWSRFLIGEYSKIMSEWCLILT